MVVVEPAIRALVVDDDAAVCDSLCEYLAKNGVEATGAPDLATAQHLLSQHTFDVAVFDLMLGHDNSMALMRQIVARGGPPVIIVSAIHGEADRVLGTFTSSGAADIAARSAGSANLSAAYRRITSQFRVIVNPSDAESELDDGTAWRT